ncbi:MAG: hypothetical protein GY810_13625 [Aureispira sp.]|nr:hypothetical protein [Aureispira sp.]
MKTVIILCFLSLVFQGCLVSSLVRPKLTGYIYDYNNCQPLDSCKVGEVITDSTGYFCLKEKRGVGFAMIALEAPPVVIHEVVQKKGYVEDRIEIFGKWAGFSPKGTHWKCDTIFLKKQ